MGSILPHPERRQNHQMSERSDLDPPSQQRQAKRDLPMDTGAGDERTSPVCVSFLFWSSSQAVSRYSFLSTTHGFIGKVLRVPRHIFKERGVFKLSNRSAQFAT